MCFDPIRSCSMPSGWRSDRASRPSPPSHRGCVRAERARAGGRPSSSSSLRARPRREPPAGAQQRSGGGPSQLPTSQDRLLEARRAFQRAVSQATERLILSYPRADARSGRERLPSLFFAAAASTLAGRPLAGAELDRLVTEDAGGRVCRSRTRSTPVSAIVSGCCAIRRAATAIAAGSAFFRQSRLASQARWSARLTRHDGLIGDADEALRERLDPPRSARPPSGVGEPSRDLCALRLPLPAAVRPAAPAGTRAGGAAPARAPGAGRPVPPGGRALPARAARPGRASPARRRRDAGATCAAWPKQALEGLVAGRPAALHAALAAREAPLPPDAAGVAGARGWIGRSLDCPRTSRSASGSAGGATARSLTTPSRSRSSSATGARCACPAASTGSTGASAAAWCCATTRPGAPRATTAASSAAASSCRSPSTCSPPPSCSRVSRSWTPFSTTSTAGGRWLSGRSWWAAKPFAGCWARSSR